MIAAGSLAAERDENVVGRLARGLAGLSDVVAAKVALAALVALALGVGLTVALGVAVELGDVRGGQPWGRVPLVAGGLVLAGASLGALGALVAAIGREARTALLAAVALALPLAFLAVVPSDVLPVAAAVGDLFPVEHSVRFFSAALYDRNPWREVAGEAVWLAAIAAALTALARIAARRLLV